MLLIYILFSHQHGPSEQIRKAAAQSWCDYDDPMERLLCVVDNVSPMMPRSKVSMRNCMFATITIKYVLVLFLVTHLFEIGNSSRVSRAGGSGP